MKYVRPGSTGLRVSRLDELQGGEQSAPTGRFARQGDGSDVAQARRDG